LGQPSYIEQASLLRLTGCAEHLTVLPVEYAHAQNVYYVKLLTYVLTQKTGEATACLQPVAAHLPLYVTAKNITLILFRVQLRFTFDLCKMHSTQLLNLCCTSGSLTIFTADVRHRLHWLALQQRVEYKVSLLAYNCLHQAAPSYLADMCVHVSATDNRCHLRSATHGDLAVPRVRLARYGRSFSVLVRCCELTTTDCP